MVEVKIFKVVDVVFFAVEVVVIVTVVVLVTVMRKASLITFIFI